MCCENDRVYDLKVAYIGGGSRGWAWGFMKDLAIDGQMSGTVRLYDIDRNAAERNEIIGNRISAHPEAKSHWKYEVSDSLGQALTGADFVVISILPGTFEEMRSDVHMPERLGIWQPVGDTVGPGGFMRAMRTIPMYIEIAEKIREYAPEAWVINYTNPMTLCVQTLYTVYPGIKAFGCCHEVFGTQKLLAAMIKQQKGIDGIDRHDIYTTVTGINHFTWLTRASWRGMDLMPMYREFAEKYHETGFRDGKDTNWMNSVFRCGHRVKFDLFLKYGAIAAAGDRHLAEFVPRWYTSSPDSVDKWQFGLTSVDWRVDDLSRRLAKSDKMIDESEKFNLENSGEEGYLLMKALLGLGDIVSNVNIPNQGQIPDLPVGAVVETNALFGYNRIEPILAGPTPKSILPLIARHVLNQSNTLQAAITYDRDLGFSTFMNDPQLSGIGLDEGKKLFDDMMEAQRKYLPVEWFTSHK